MGKRMENVNEFETLMSLVEREGKDELMEYIRNSDFYTAPASTRFHLSAEGGLLQHSLNVYHCLMAKRDNDVWGRILESAGKDSLTIVSLFHDICKTGFYTTELRWRKDSNNRWEQYPVYAIDDQLPYGHGEKSVMMIEKFMRLKDYEKFAIRWHMGFSEPAALYPQVGKAMEMYPLALALYEADLEATKILEVEK